MKILLYLFLVLSSFGLYAQSYDDKSEASELCLLAQQNSFMNDEKAEIALNKILSVIGASKRFIMQPCSDINNAVATSYKGLRYILYDKEFTNTIAENTTAWSQLFILAHEVGHHINGHSIDILLVVADIVEPENLAAKRQQEIESDEFAGFILGKLGATLEQTSEVVNLLISNKNDEYSTHPNKTKRLHAIKVGYNKALGKTPVAYDKPTELQTAEEYFYSGCKKQNMNDHYGAIEDYNKAININPSLNYAYYNRGISKGKLEDKHGAMEDYTKAITIDPNDADPYNNRGNLKREWGDYYGAIADLTKAIDIDPNDAADPYYNRGNVKDELKDYYGAIADYTKAIDINPKLGVAYNNKGKSKLALKDYQGALNDFTEAIGLNPKNSAAFNNRGIAKSKLKDDYGAIADFTKAIDINPNFSNAYYNRGVIKYYLSDNTRACEDAHKAQILGYDASRFINIVCN